MNTLRLITLLCSILIIDALSVTESSSGNATDQTLSNPNLEIEAVDSNDQIDKPVDSSTNDSINSFPMQDNEIFNFTLIFFTQQYKFVEFRSIDQFIDSNVIYNPEYKNVFLIHGWRSKWRNDFLRFLYSTNNNKPGNWLEQLKNMIFEKEMGKVNLFIVDWSNVAEYESYFNCARFIKYLGKQLASFIELLHSELNIDMNSIHMIGHSLGAHAAAFASKNLKSYDNLVIGRITALDPANLEFTVENPNDRLDKTDARYVEVLHTNMALHPIFGLGNVLKLGHFDLYLNGGQKQPGCTGFVTAKRRPNIFRRKLNSFVCDHSRSIYFYMEESAEVSTCQKIAYACANYKKFKSGLCNDCGLDNEKCRSLDYANALVDPSSDASIISNYSYYLDTNAESPFCTNHYSLEIEIEETKYRKDTFDLIVNGEKDKEVFEIKADWANSTFTTLLTTAKELGRLESAIVAFRNKFLFNNRDIKFKSLSLYYMSNFEAKIRDSLSAGMIAHSSYGNAHIFEVDL